MRRGCACFTPEFRDFFEGWERFDCNKNWHLQKRGEWVIVYRKGEGVEPDELQTFLRGTAEIVRNREAGTAKQEPPCAIPTQYSRDHADAQCLRVFRFRQQPLKR
jgi:hypothetical protein